jgi:hypothetical protein
MNLSAGEQRNVEADLIRISGNTIVENAIPDRVSLLKTRSEVSALPTQRYVLGA